MQSVCSEIRFCEKSRVKRSFWKGLSLLVKVFWKMLVLEAWIVILVKVSCKTLVLEALVKVSWKILVLEAWIVTFVESLVENARFGSLDCHFWWKSRGKCLFWTFGNFDCQCLFWKLGLSLLVKVSWKMLVLEAWTVTFGKVSWRMIVLEACLVCKSVLTREASKSVKQECLRVSRKSVKQRVWVGVSCNSVQQECQSRNV